MNITFPFENSPTGVRVMRTRFRMLPAIATAAIICAAASTLVAQDQRGDERRRRGGDGGGERGNFNPQDMQARMMNGLRERMGVTNDEEWTLISDRITKISEARRAMGGGVGGMMFAGRGGPPPGATGGDRGSGRGGRGGGSPENAALVAAITDKLPDAEIKARLERVRQVRKESETKLAKAQEELRSVLSVRQEAIAVLAGLLP